jgi:hypothetical protein
MRNFVYFVIAIMLTGSIFSFIGSSPAMAAENGKILTSLTN